MGIASLMLVLLEAGAISGVSALWSGETPVDLSAVSEVSQVHSGHFYLPEPSFLEGGDGEAGAAAGEPLFDTNSTCPPSAGREPIVKDIDGDGQVDDQVLAERSFPNGTATLCCMNNGQYYGIIWTPLEGDPPVEGEPRLVPSVPTCLRQSSPQGLV